MVREASETGQQVQADGPLRREGDRTLPAGPRARRTRASLLDAAAALFASQGYRDTTVGQIAAQAGVALGTFYQYFRDRADIMSTIVREGAVRELKVDVPWDPSRGKAGVERMITGFVRFYAATAPFQAVWEEVTHVEAEMAELRRETTRLFTAVIERALRQAAANGTVRDDLDMHSLARALTAMVDRYCYLTYVFDPPAGGVPSPEETAGVLSEMWADAVRLRS